MEVSHPFIYSSHQLVNNYYMIFYHSIPSDSYTALLSTLRYPKCCSSIAVCCYGITASVFLQLELELDEEYPDDDFGEGVRALYGEGDKVRSTVRKIS